MQSFFRELRRRNVFRVAGVYAVVGWLIAQIASILESSLSLPDWFDAVVVTLLLLGLPIALLFAWAFEMTPEGVKPTKSVPEDQSITAKTGQRLDYVIIAGLVLVIGLVGFQMIASPAGPQAEPVRPVATDASIAVLPFVDMSVEGDQEYFSDGIAEELLNVLAQIPELQVAGRTSAFAFKGQKTDLREIGEILQVAHILEGSVRKAGGKVRITAQLIEADTGYHLWSETYDRNLDDIFAVQDEISAAITAELVPRLTGEPQKIQVARASDIDAYDLYLLARQQEKGGRAEDFRKAADTLDQALEIDPDYVPALAWRGYYELMTSDATGAMGDKPFDEAAPIGRVFIAKAMELDSGSPDALFAQAGLYLFEKNYAAAERHYKLAIAQRPNFPYARNDLGFAYMQQGMEEEALEQFEIALEHDPALADANVNVISLNLGNGSFDRAKAALDRWERISPDSPAFEFAQLFYYSAVGALGDVVLLHEAQPEDRRSARVDRYMPFVWSTLGEYEKAMEISEPQFQPLIMLAMQKPAEAEKQARANMEEDPSTLDAYLQILHLTQQWDKIVDYYEKNYSSAVAFEASEEHPPYVWVVPALVFREHADAGTLLDAWEEHVKGHLRETPVDNDTEVAQARVAALRGESSDVVLGHLERAFELGERNPSLGIEPVWRTIEDQTRFNALVDRTEAAINVERQKLDLPPKPMLKDIGG